MTFMNRAETKNWYETAVIYQIYPFGLCGAPFQNDGILQNRIEKVLDFVPHIKALNVNAIYFSPVFSSDSHGYDTRDYRVIDCRLGSNENFATLCKELHKNEIKIILDGVFNHVGRGFWAFQDVLKNRENSPYKDWFNINFSGNSNYNDGLWYEGWEGHFELVKLNLKNPAVKEHIFEAVKGWVDEFDIDGLRLDVAYLLDENFLRELKGFCRSLKPDFFLLGEMLHGDYNRLVKPAMLDSCTNYECYKGLYSAIISNNMFEIAHSLNRQFGKENWALYRGKNLVCFLDNHDVSRIASILQSEKALSCAYGLLFSMPGIPCIYYGSEWGIKGDKSQGDNALRPALDMPIENELTEYITALAKMKQENIALCLGDFENLHIASKQLAFVRSYENERLLCVLNIDENTASIPIKLAECKGVSLLTGKEQSINGKLDINGMSFDCFKI